MRLLRILGFLSLQLILIFAVTGCPDDDLEAPTGVKATWIDNNQTHITWNGVTGANYYIIAYRTNMDSETTRTPVANRVNNTTYTHDHNIFNNPLAEFYYYYVIAGKSGTDGNDDKFGEWTRSNPIYKDNAGE